MQKRMNDEMMNNDSSGLEAQAQESQSQSPPSEPQAQQAPSQQPSLTEEQVRQLLKEVNITDEQVAQAFAIDPAQHGPQLKQTTAFFQGLVKQIVDHVNALNNLRLELLLRQQINPMLEFYQQYQNERYEREFAEAFPDVPLDLARIVYRDMVNTGTRFKSKEEAFKAIADKAMAVIGRSSQNNSPRMSSLTTTGRPASKREVPQQGGLEAQVKALFG